MTPVGHCATAVVASSLLRSLPLRWLLLGAMAPDIDFIFVFRPEFNSWHRGPTHSLVFVAVLGLAAAVASSAKTRRSTVAAVCLGAALHVLADGVLDANPSNGIGVALFWPFYDRAVSPGNLVEILAPGSASDTRWDSDNPVGVLPMVAWSLAADAFLAAIVAALLWRRRTQGNHSQKPIEQRGLRQLFRRTESEKG